MIQSYIKMAKNCMHWNVAPDARPGSAMLVHVMDRWLNNCNPQHVCHMQGYDTWFVCVSVAVLVATSFISKQKSRHHRLFYGVFFDLTFPKGFIHEIRQFLLVLTIMATSLPAGFHLGGELEGVCALPWKLAAPPPLKVPIYTIYMYM